MCSLERGEYFCLYICLAAPWLCKHVAAHGAIDQCARLFEDNLFVFAVRALDAHESAPVFSLETYHPVSLRKFEFPCPEAFAQVCFAAYGTTVADIDLLGGLVAAGHLGELAHIPDLASTGFLAVDPVHVAILPFLDLLDLMNLVLSAEGTVGRKFTWHFHGISPVHLILNPIIIC
jgi:hypothetical protein